MGCGMSTEEKEGKARNEEIENQLKRDRMQQRNEIKMLLLGMFRALPLNQHGDLLVYIHCETPMPFRRTASLINCNRCW